MTANNKRPGMMFYFDTLPTMEEYSNEEVGMILRALLIYGMTGEEPKLGDRGLRTLWKELKKKADWDEEKYKTVCISKQYAVYCREAKKEGREPLTREEWERDHVISNDDSDIQQQIATAVPNKTAIPERETTAATVTKPSAKAAATTNSVIEEGMGGELDGKQMVHRDENSLYLSEAASEIFRQYIKAYMEGYTQLAMEYRLRLENEYGCNVQELMRREGYDSG